MESFQKVGSAVLKIFPASDFLNFYLSLRQEQGHDNMPITVAPYYLTHLVRSSFFVGGNWSTRRELTTFGNALTYYSLNTSPTTLFPGSFLLGNPYYNN